MHSLFYFSRILPLWNSKEIIRIKLLQARQTTLYSTNGQIKVSKSLVNWPLYWIKSKTFSFYSNFISPIRLHFPPLSEANISNLSQTVKNVLNLKKNKVEKGANFRSSNQFTLLSICFNLYIYQKISENLVFSYKNKIHQVVQDTFNYKWILL